PLSPYGRGQPRIVPDHPRYPTAYIHALDECGLRRSRRNSPVTDPGGEPVRFGIEAFQIVKRILLHRGSNELAANAESKSDFCVLQGRILGPRAGPRGTNKCVRADWPPAIEP